MPRHRCAWGTCNSDTRYKDREYMSGVKFFSFPRPVPGEDSHLQTIKCKEWINCCGRPGNQLNLTTIHDDYTKKKKYYRICSKHFLDGKPTRYNPNPIPALSNRKHLQEKRKSSEATPPPSKYRKCLDTASSVAAAGSEQTDQTSKPDRSSGQEIYPYDEGTQSHTSEIDQQPDAADEPLDSSLQKRSARKSPRKKRVKISTPSKVSPLRTLLNEPKLIDAPLLQPLPEKAPMKLTENELSPAEISTKEEAPMDLSLKKTLKKATQTDSPSENSSSFKRTAQTGKSSRLRKTSSKNCSSVEISPVHASLNDVSPIDLSMKTVEKKTTTPIKIKLKKKILGRKKEIKSKNKVSCPHCHRCFSPTAEERTRIAAGSTSIRNRSGTKVSDRCLIDIDPTDERRHRGRRLDWDTKLGSAVSWESRLMQHSTDVPPLALPASRSPSPGRPAHHMPHSVPVAVSKSTSALSADNLPCPGRSKDAPTTTDRGDRSHTALCTTPPPETNAAVQPSCAPDQPNPQQALNPGTLDTMAEDASGKRVVLVAIDASKQAEDAVRWYFQFLHRPENKVILVNVPEGATITTTQGQKLSDGEIQKMIDKEKKMTEALHAKFDGIQTELSVTAEYLTVYGKPGEALVKAAHDQAANMVVMGTRGLGTIRRTILGSVSDYVVHHAHCPVIVCRH